MSDASAEVAEALKLLKGLSFFMGHRDAAFDKTAKEAVEHLEKARAALGAGPAPLSAAPSEGVEPSIIEWIYSASANALKAAELMPPGSSNPTQVEVLAGALLSLREWASRQLPPERRPAPPSSEMEPLQLS